MLKKLLASTALVTLIAGGAYAQSTNSEQPQVQADQQQDRVASAHGQEIFVEDGDTVTLDSADIEFTIRLNSGGTSVVPSQNMAETSPTTADSATDDADDMAEATDDATNQTASGTTTETSDRVASSDAMSDGGMRVSHGDILVVRTDDEKFSLNFEISEADDVAAGMTSTDMNAPSGTVAGTDSTTTGAIDRSNMQARSLDQIRAEELIGSNIYGADDANIGTVGDVIMTQDGKVDAVLVDVGGFLGIGTREVAVGLDNIEFMVDDSEKWYVYTPFTEEQLEAQPEYNADTYANERDQQRLVVR